jgi:hypothetical protein
VAITRGDNRYKQDKHQSIGQTGKETYMGRPRKDGGTKFTVRVNPLTPNDLERRRAVSPLQIKIPNKNVREKPTNKPIIHSVY